MKPPTTAPAIPKRMVTTTPPGSFPGMIHFAKNPAIRPKTIHDKMPIAYPPFVRVSFDYANPNLAAASSRSLRRCVGCGQCNHSNARIVEELGSKSQQHDATNGGHRELGTRPEYLRPLVSNDGERFEPSKIT